MSAIGGIRTRLLAGVICQNRKFPMVKNTNARIQSAAVRTVRLRVGFWFRNRRSRQKNSVTMPPRMHKASNASQYCSRNR